PGRPGPRPRGGPPGRAAADRTAGDGVPALPQCPPSGRIVPEADPAERPRVAPAGPARLREGRRPKGRLHRRPPGPADVGPGAADVCAGAGRVVAGGQGDCGAGTAGRAVGGPFPPVFYASGCSRGIRQGVFTTPLSSVLAPRFTARARHPPPP